MAYNLGTIIIKVQRKLDNSSFDTAILTDFANDTQREIFNRYRLGFNEREDQSITTTVGSTALTGLPTDMSIPLSLRLFTPINYANVIPYIEYEDVDVAYPNINLVGTGPPIAWTVFNGIPVLVNRADAIYTLYMKYVKTPIELANNSDVPEIPLDFQEVLVLGMYARALEHDDEFAKAAAVRQQMDSIIIDINNRVRRQFGVPHIMRQPLRRNRRFGVR